MPKATTSSSSKLCSSKLLQQQRTTLTMKRSEEVAPLIMDKLYLTRVSLKCEKFLRHYFRLDETEEDVIEEFQITNESPFDLALRSVLLNFLYDVYMRLALTNRDNLILYNNEIGTTCLLWSIFKAKSLNCDLEKMGSDIVKFSDNLNNLRQSTTMDILSENCLQILEKSILKKNKKTSHSFSMEENSSISVAPQSLSDIQEPTTTGVKNFILTELKTFYNVNMENLWIDHSKHYEMAYVPLYRFSNDFISSLNMSRFIGNTMKNNIRVLYKFISELIDDSNSCPCVIIFNFFIRDVYRMYHSKSMQQNSFTRICNSEHTDKCISFILITNIFPKVTSWFKSINNQLMKKVGKTKIYHLDSYVRFIVESFYAYNDQKKREYIQNFSKIVKRKNGNKNNNKNLEKNKIVKRKKKKRLNLSQLFEGKSINDVFDKIFENTYIGCKHLNIQRMYEQKRSNDESATLVRICKDCLKIV